MAILVIEVRGDDFVMMHKTVQLILQVADVASKDSNSDKSQAVHAMRGHAMTACDLLRAMKVSDPRWTPSLCQVPGRTKVS
jgi:hypothetical protein